MVGLSAFGESAWELEQVMNLWLSQSLAVTPEFLGLASDARELLAEWTYALQGGEEPALDANSITMRARELRGTPPMAATPVTVTVAPDTPATVEIPVAAEPPPPIPSAETAPGAPAEPLPEDFMTLMMPATRPNEAVVPAASESPPPTASREQALADLGARLSQLIGLINEIQTQTATPQTRARLQEIAREMQENMADASALHRALNDHIETLKRST
jgi:chemosensory pili system protein ChpA (sensor histidine kinase/response regulator)